MRILFILFVLIAIRVTMPCDSGNCSGAENKAAHQTLVKYCIDCHDSDSAEGGFDVSAIDGTLGVMMNHHVARRVIDQMESQSMPPEEPRPSDDEVDQVKRWILETLDNADWETLREPAEWVPSRISRSEYRNSMCDVFGVNMKVDDLIADDSVGANGFDNDRASLVMTESRFSQYLEAANRVATALIDYGQGQAEFQLESEDGKLVTTNGRKSIKTLDDGTVGFEFQHHRGIKYQQISHLVEFPYTGLYEFRLRAKCQADGKQGGVWIAIDSVREHIREAVVLVDQPEFREYSAELFVEAGHREVIFGSDFRAVPWLPPVPEMLQRKLPANRDEVVDEFYSELGIQKVEWHELEKLPGFTEPEDKAAAMLVVEELNRLLLDESIRVYELFRIYEEHQFLPVNEPKGFRKTAVSHQNTLGKLIGVDHQLLHELWMSHEPQVHLQNESQSKLLIERWHGLNSHRKSMVGNVFFDSARVIGPIAFDKERANELIKNFGLNPNRTDGQGNVDAVRSALRDLLPVLFRRDVGPEDVDSYLKLYRRERNAGADHQTAVKRVLIATLMSPQFLYIGGSEQAAKSLQPEIPLTNAQLASRLSYLFWKTAPDTELKTAVAQLDRSNTSAIEDLVSKLVKDARSDRFYSDFTSQWLGLDSLGREKTPDSELFREFSWQLAEDMRKEVALKFKDVIIQDRNLLDLLDSQETFLNERLARLYGIDSKIGVQFQPFTLSNGQRSGLLGTGAVLATTSLPARTSPVQRGKFVIETLLGEDLPPPPEDAGTLDENAGQSVASSLRDQLAAHRDKPSCMGCHQRIDPVGFALEKFDFVGRQREQSVAGEIDDTGVLAGGQKVTGLAQLNEFLRNQRGDAFIENLTRRLLAYCLGRDLDYRDEADVRAIIKAVSHQDGSARSLVSQIVQSRAFLMRKR